MLTTTIDGLWVLQVLCGVETLAAELGLRPHLPSVETARTALTHPAAEELRRCGVITPAGVVDEPVREWLTVLSRREVAVLLRVQSPTARCDRILIARFAQWWAVLERCGNTVRLSGAGTATAEESAGALISTQIDRACGPRPVAGIRSLTVDVDEMLDTVRDGPTLRRFLAGQAVDADQVTVLTAAADQTRSTHVSVVAVQSASTDTVAGPHVEPGAVTIIDSPHGRVLCEQLRHGGRRWMIAGPGSPPAIDAAVRTMMHRLPSRDQWFRSGKAA